MWSGPQANDVNDTAQSTKSNIGLRKMHGWGTPHRVSVPKRMQAIWSWSGLKQFFWGSDGGLDWGIIGSAEALPTLCVRYIRWERERERRKWRHHCRAKIGDEFCTSPCQKCAPLVLAKSFALFLAKKFAPQFSPSWMALSSHFPLPKRCTFRNSSHSSQCHMAWMTGDRSSKANDRISCCTVLLYRRNSRKIESN